MKTFCEESWIEETEDYGNSEVGSRAAYIKESMKSDDVKEQAIESFIEDLRDELNKLLK